MKNKIMTLVLISGFAAVQAKLTPEQEKSLEILWQKRWTMIKCSEFVDILSNRTIMKKNDKLEVDLVMRTFLEEKLKTFDCPDFKALLQARNEAERANKVLNDTEKTTKEIQINSVSVKEFQDFCIKNKITKQEFSDFLKKCAHQEHELMTKELEEYLKSRGLDLKDFQ